MRKGKAITVMLDKDKLWLEKEMKGLVEKWQTTGTLILKLQSHREFLKRCMMEILEGIGSDRYEDSEGNLWVLKRCHDEPWRVDYIPVESRLKQQPKFQIKTTTK